MKNIIIPEDSYYSIVIIKPDAYSKRSQILKYFQDYQYEILVDPIILTRKFVEEFYKEHRKKSFYAKLVEFMLSGNVMVLKILGDENIIKEIRFIVEKVIRPKYGTDSTANAIHASDSLSSSKREYSIIKRHILDRYVLETGLMSSLNRLNELLKTM